MIAARFRKSRIATATVSGHETKTSQLRQPTLIPLVHVAKPLNKQNLQAENDTTELQKMNDKHTMDINKRNTSPFQEPLNDNSHNIIQVIPTFQIINETEKSQIETLRRVAENFVSHFDEEELDELAFSSTRMLGSLLGEVPRNVKIAKKLQVVFRIGNYKVVQSYLSAEQLVIVIVRSGSEMDPDRKIRTPRRASSVRARVLRAKKLGLSVDHTGHKGRIPDTISESPEPIETNGRFIRHRRSNDYITLYDEISKVGSPEDVTSITGSNKKDKQNKSSPEKMEGDSGYFSTSSEENDSVLEGSGVAAATKKCFKTTPSTDSSSDTPRPSNSSPSSPTIPSSPFANRPILINCFTNNSPTSPVLEKSTRKYSDIPSPFRSRPLIPRESSNTINTPTEGTATSRLPVIRKKALGELHPNVRKIAPIIKSKVNVGAANQTSTSLASSDMMKYNSVHSEQSDKKAKRPLINYAKLRGKTVEANTAVVASTTSTNSSSESGDGDGDGDSKRQSLQPEASISLQEGEKSTSTSNGTEDSTNIFSPPAIITSSTTSSDEIKVKKPLKNFSKARLLAKNRKSEINQSTTETTTEESGSPEGLSPPSDAVTMSLCPSSDPDRPQSSLSRCSSASSLFTEYPPIPIDFLQKVKKPLKNFRKARISAGAKNAGPHYEAPAPNMEYTPVGIPERKAFTSLLPKASTLLSKATFVKSLSLQDKTSPPTIVHHTITQDSKKAIVDDQSLTVEPQMKFFAKYRAKALSNGSSKKPPILKGQEAQPMSMRTFKDTLSALVAPGSNTLARAEPSSQSVTPKDSHQEIDINASQVATIMDTVTPPTKGPPTTTSTINSTGASTVTTLKLELKSHSSNLGAQNRSKDCHRIVTKQDPRLNQVPVMNTKTKRTVCPVSNTISNSSLSESIDLPAYTARLSENHGPSTRPHPIPPCSKNSDTGPTSSRVRAKSTKTEKPTTPAILLKASYVETRGRNKLTVTPTHGHRKSSYVRSLTWS